ncbi:hypothetical protein BLOT_012970 [Blomia tropicalis]|nr:hypothetical protein BLOT_012970 [Blomia tropicalis]
MNEVSHFLYADESKYILKSTVLLQTKSRERFFHNQVQKIIFNMIQHFFCFDVPIVYGIAMFECGELEFIMSNMVKLNNSRILNTYLNYLWGKICYYFLWSLNEFFIPMVKSQNS